MAANFCIFCTHLKKKIYKFFGETVAIANRFEIKEDARSDFCSQKSFQNRADAKNSHERIVLSGKFVEKEPFGNVDFQKVDTGADCFFGFGQAFDAVGDYFQSTYSVTCIKYFVFCIEY